MSRPGGKIRGKKSHKHGKKHPELSKGFPRDTTRAYTGPEFTRGMTRAQANAAWFTWLRVLGSVRPM